MIRLLLHRISELAMLVFIAWLDYLTGPELAFSVFYFIPLAIIGWHNNKAWILFCSLFGSFLWYVADWKAGHFYSDMTIGYWNAGIRLLSFLIISFTFSRLRIILDYQKVLNQQLTQAMAEVRQLSGLLPICAACKKIRDKEGSWRQIEEYIRDHSEADFSHGICPECARRLYPDFTKQDQLS